MLNVDTHTYKNAVAEAIIKARDNLKDHNDTLKDHTATLDDHGTTLDNHTTELGSHATELGLHNTDISKITSNTFSPAGCTDGTKHWIFVVGTDNQVWYRYYDGNYWVWWNGSAWVPGSSNQWNNLGGSFASGPAAYCAGGYVWIYGTGSDRQTWQRRLTVSTGVWTAWYLIGGQAGSLGQ